MYFDFNLTKSENIAKIMQTKAQWLSGNYSAEERAVLLNHCTEYYKGFPELIEETRTELELLPPIINRFLSRCVSNGTDLVFVYADNYDPDFCPSHDTFDDD